MGAGVNSYPWCHPGGHGGACEFDSIWLVGLGSGLNYIQLGNGSCGPNGRCILMGTSDLEIGLSTIVFLAIDHSRGWVSVDPKCLRGEVRFDAIIIPTDSGKQGFIVDDLDDVEAQKVSMGTPGRALEQMQCGHAVS